uniref:Uncharacterized protein n=1 Tax=Rhizophora mucronata TaxID=61149 RepID=A0A2P2PG78_RHIMU
MTTTKQITKSWNQTRQKDHSLL